MNVLADLLLAAVADAENIVVTDEEVDKSIADIAEAYHTTAEQIKQAVPYESMRDDMTRIADAFGGTRANILRLAVPPRVAKVESQLRVGNRDAAGTAAGKQRLAAVDQEIYGQLQRQYGNINLLHDALQGRRFQSFVFDLLPGADHWRRCAAWGSAGRRRQPSRCSRSA
mgnify:CR=1 FL=1